MKSVLEVEVSVYQSYMHPMPFEETLTLLEWVTHNGFKDEVNALRKLTNLKKIKDAKAELPAITPSGLFNGKRAHHTLKKHSGFICLDVDGKDNPHISDWEKAKSAIGNSVNVAYAGLSASGRGIFMLIPIAYPEKHAEHFTALQFYFLAEYGITVDKACRDVCRLRGISYDSNPYFNHNATLVTKYIEQPKIGSLRQDEPINNNNAIKQVLDDVMSLKTDITGNYNDWFNIGCVIANEYGEKGRTMYHELSKLSPKYKSGECDRQYSACLKTKYSYTVGTLKYIYNKYYSRKFLE
ncbi:MAG: PriCT-2 domain-containing protein [Bacteroidetes bacterium]|nr:PriCT-2 domain-containing protein [Bacteroidota bacterium]